MVKSEHIVILPNRVNFELVATIVQLRKPLMRVFLSEHISIYVDEFPVQLRNKLFGDTGLS